MKEIPPQHLESVATALIRQEQRLAFKANQKKDPVALTEHISRSKIMTEFAESLGVLRKTTP